MARNGLDVTSAPAYVGTHYIATLWNIEPGTARGYVDAAVRHGEWRYLPVPDFWYIRDDKVALPMWTENTIANFERPQDVYGPGYHARGADRKGYKEGAFTKVYRSTLGVANAEEIRRKYRNDEASIEGLAKEYGLRPREVQRVIDGLRWMPGTVGKNRGRMDSPAMETLGIEKAEEIRDRADAGEASINELAEQFGIREEEVEAIIDGERWAKESTTLAAS